MMLKCLFLGTTVALAALPARAQTVELSCSLTPPEQQNFISAGYPDKAKRMMYLNVDKPARKVTVLESNADAADANRSVYDAEFKGSVATWTIGDPKDGVRDSVNINTNILTTVDPLGEATQWSCSAS